MIFGDEILILTIKYFKEAASLLFPKNTDKYPGFPQNPQNSQ
jgi:hypothetical protein